MSGARNLKELEGNLYRAREEADLYHLQADLSMKAGEQVWWNWDIPSGRLTMRSSGSCVLGYENVDRPAPEQFWWDRIHPDDRDEVRASLYASFTRKGQEWHSEHRLRDITGEWVWVEQTGIVQRHDEQGEPVEMVGILRMVEERHVLLELFQGSEALVDTLIRDSSIVLRLLDLNGREIAASGEWKTRLSRGDFPFAKGSKDHGGIIPPEDWQQAFQKARNGRAARRTLTAGSNGSVLQYIHELLPVLQDGETLAILELLTDKPA